MSNNLENLNTVISDLNNEGSTYFAKYANRFEKSLLDNSNLGTTTAQSTNYVVRNLGRTELQELDQFRQTTFDEYEARNFCQLMCPDSQCVQDCLQNLRKDID